MTLPIFQLASDEYTFPDGQTVKYRELSRAEALQIGMLGPVPDEIEAHAIAFATDTPLDETRQWLDSTPQAIARGFFDAIKELSGLGEEVGKDDGGASPLENRTE